MQVAAAGGQDDAIAEVVEAHLGTSPVVLEPVRATYPRWRWADVDAALDRLDAQALRGVIGAHSEGLGELVQDMYGSYRLGAVQRSAFPVGPGEVRYVATNALRFAIVQGRPVVTYAHLGDGMEETDVHVEVLAGDPALARQVLADLDAEVVYRSSLRGRVVSFVHGAPFGDEPTELVFHERPAFTADDVVLPLGRLERVEATVLGVTAKAEQLRAAAQHLSRGVLLYGPPGTGKTHTVRYLLAQSPQTTAFILQGPSLGLIRQAAVTARQLQPAIIVLEDADLVAADREMSEGERPVLFEMLDVMDGLDDDADVAFVLTTNRVDVLEEALALRPGRIDLAVEIPLPTVQLRERLFARSARALPVTATGIRTAAEAAVATTGSFPKEAVRRAVLDALADGVDIDDARLVAAVRGLMAEGTELRAAMNHASEDDVMFDGDDAAEGSDVAEGDDTSEGHNVEWGADAEWDEEESASRNGEAEGLKDAALRSGGIDLDELDEVDYADDLDDGLSGEDLLDLDLDDD